MSLGQKLPGVFSSRVPAGKPTNVGILRRDLDRRPSPGCHLVLSGSSQRMMQGLVMDRTAPLYGRAREILRVEPLAAGWLQDALGKEPVRTVEASPLLGAGRRVSDHRSRRARPSRGAAGVVQVGPDQVLDALC